MTEALPTVSHAIREAAARLAATSDTARLDAEVLMAHALNTSRSDLLLRHMGHAVPAQFAASIERRLQHEPVAYIVGHQEFYGLPFRVNRDVLIPRADSEVVVEHALAAQPTARRVLDCGTGSGALLLAVLTNLLDADGMGIDRSEEALAVARSNAQVLKLEVRARFLTADWSQPGWDEGLGGRFDLILANPPYVEEQADLHSSVRSFEPAGALFAGEDGLDAYHLLIPQMPALLAPRGAALVEIGSSQADAVSAIANAAGLCAQVHLDLGGRPRALELSFGG
ncbi:peptide chain release factor N(5)-glutamine methyltransferase [Novosphingobium sp. RD2P27]|uniref:Release factor glutamine methyltransferase n=1 Tax=Novosphingobium kalidii TaxID=3230299 RepID=A0ABV2D709_9SPHN